MYNISQCLKETPMGDIVSESRELNPARKLFLSKEKHWNHEANLYTKVSFKFCILKVVWKASYVLDKDLFRNQRNTQCCPSSIFCSILRSISRVQNLYLSSWNHKFKKKLALEDLEVFRPYLQRSLAYLPAARRVFHKTSQWSL